MSFSQYRYYIKRQFFIFISAFILTFSAESAMAVASPLVVSTHAAPLIVNYLQNHPEEITTFKNMKSAAYADIKTINENSATQLENEIDLDKPQSPILIHTFPIQSHLLTPGKVHESHIDIVLPQPVFIVGNDHLSIKWLDRYEKRLMQLNAIGFVVNIASNQDFLQLKNAFPNLLLMAMPADSLATNLHLKHYPVLISDKLIEQ